MPQRKLNHLPDPLDLAVQTPYVLVGDDGYALLLGVGLAHHLDDGRFCNLYRSVRTGPRCDERYRAAENAEERHVSLNKRHVHEAALDESYKLLVHAQSDVSWREDYCLRILDFRLFDRDILVQGYSRVSSEEPIHPNYFLALILSVSRPGDRNGGPLSMYVDEVPCCYGELLHRLIIDPDLPVSYISLFGVSDSQLHFFWHGHCISSLTLL